MPAAASQSLDLFPEMGYLTVMLGASLCFQLADDMLMPTFDVSLGFRFHTLAGISMLTCFLLGFRLKLSFSIHQLTLHG